MFSKTFPKEVLIKILCLLDRRDLKPSMYVCKEWYVTAVPLYFQKIWINTKNIKTDSLFLNGHLTRELDLYCAFDEKSRKSKFLRLLSSLPNLKKLDFQLTEFINHYAYILQQLDNITLYPQGIEEITFGRNFHTSHCAANFLACYKFCKSIKRLETHVSNNDLMLATSKSLIYFLPQFTCLTKLTFYRQDQDDVTLFDILLCCENIIDLKYTSQASIPYRATSQVNTTNNKHLKRLTISSPISTSAYINYIRIVQPLDYLKLSTPQDRYEIFQVIEPFAEVFQKFKEFRLKFKGCELSSIPPSLTDTFYNVLCKLKGDRNLLYDATFSDDGYVLGDTVAICDNKLTFCYVVGESASLSSNNTYCLVDSEEIVKAVTINGRRSSFTGILNYAKTFPRAKNFNINTHDFNCKINKTEVIINCSSPSQEIFAHLKDCSPHAETIAFEQEINFVCAVSETTWDLTAFKSLKSFSFIVGNCINMVFHTFLAFKFIYGDFHCYKKILLKKNIPVVDTAFEDTFTVIVKVHSQLVKINCNTKKLTTQLNLKYIH